MWALGRERRTRLRTARDSGQTLATEIVLFNEQFAISLFSMLLVCFVVVVVVVVVGLIGKLWNVSGFKLNSFYRNSVAEDLLCIPIPIAICSQSQGAKTEERDRERGRSSSLQILPPKASSSPATGDRPTSEEAGLMTSLDPIGSSKAIAIAMLIYFYIAIAWQIPSIRWAQLVTNMEARSRSGWFGSSLLIKFSAPQTSLSYESTGLIPKTLAFSVRIPKVEPLACSHSWRWFDYEPNLPLPLCPSGGHIPGASLALGDCCLSSWEAIYPFSQSDFGGGAPKWCSQQCELRSKGSRRSPINLNTNKNTYTNIFPIDLINSPTQNTIQYNRQSNSLIVNCWPIWSVITSWSKKQLACPVP